jgi:phosphonate transport system permease protein
VLGLFGGVLASRNRAGDHAAHGGHFLLYLDALGRTLSIAFLATLLAAVLALPFGFLAARNVAANRLVHLLARRSLDTVRSIDVLIWALIWINVVGFGPFAGALAIASFDCEALAKLMSDAIETADCKSVEGVLASGGGRWLAIRFGLVPQVLPIFASQLLYFFESNTRWRSSAGKRLEKPVLTTTAGRSLRPC